MESEKPFENEHASSIRISPVDGSTTWSGSCTNLDELQSVIKRAKAAQVTWNAIGLKARIGMVRKYADFLHENRNEIGRFITLESGKPLWESQSEVAAAISKVGNAIEAIEARRWTTFHDSNRAAIRYRPLGLALVLGPYNLPLHLPGAHIVPALLAGNTVVFKPSEKTPAVGDWIERAWQYADLPTGVCQVIQGGIEQAKYAVAHREIDAILFTGSRRGGIEIHKQIAGRTDCLLALEMGGNNPMIVDHISDHRAAIHAILQSSYITSGQRCTCARRIVLVQSKDNELLLEELVAAIRKIRVDNPLSTTQPFMGTLVSPDAAESILKAQHELLERGAVLLHPAHRLQGNNSMLSPGLCVAESNRLEDEEHFGPLATVIWARDLAHAIELSNQTKYGLAASLLSDSREAFEFFVENIRAGIVNWNAPTTGASGRLPFGGIGASGNHRPSGYFAADYCSDPIASVENQRLETQKLPPGLEDI